MTRLPTPATRRVRSAYLPRLLHPHFLPKCTHTHTHTQITLRVILLRHAANMAKATEKVHAFFLRLFPSVDIVFASALSWLNSNKVLIYTHTLIHTNSQPVSFWNNPSRPHLALCPQASDAGVVGRGPIAMTYELYVNAGEGLGNHVTSEVLQLFPLFTLPLLHLHLCISTFLSVTLPSLPHPRPKPIPRPIRYSQRSGRS